MAAAAAARAGDFNGALASLRDASGGLPSEIWHGGVLPFLNSADVLRLSSTCSSLLSVAAAGVRRLRLRVPEGWAAEQLAGLLLLGLGLP